MSIIQPMATSSNPFRYGGVARGEYFTDRERELAALSADIRGGQDVVIVSRRRMGKTSLIEAASDQLRREKMLVAYLDLYGSPTKEALADDLAQALSDGLLSPIDRTTDKIRGWFSHLSVQPRVTVREDGMPQFEFLGYERREDADTLLDGLLELPGQVAARGHRVCVVLDEFQEVVRIDPKLPGRVRAAFQQQPEVAHVYLGSKRHLMEPLFMERAAPLYRSAKPMRLGPIDPVIFSAFLRRRFAAGGIRIAKKQLDRILALSGGLPYETQELCSYVWTEAKLAGVPVEEALIDRALVTLVDAESARYAAIWDRLPGVQRALLLALAREPGRVYSEGYRRHHKLGSASSVQRALAGLEKLDLVDSNEGGGQALADVFMRVWLGRVD
jgi:AAA+ ATPase superfamily predicted ATPase